MDTQRADMETNFGVVCYLNGQEIGKGDKFSSLKTGKSLVERTCVVGIYDKNCPNFKARLSQLLASPNLKEFLETSCIKSLSGHYAAICNFTREIFDKDYADLVNPKRAPFPPTAKSNEIFPVKKIEEEAGKETFQRNWSTSEYADVSSSDAGTSEDKVI
jgi:hypothetical protein